MGPCALYKDLAPDFKRSEMDMLVRSSEQRRPVAAVWGTGPKQPEWKRPHHSEVKQTRWETAVV